MPEGKPADEMRNLIAIAREGGAGHVEFALAVGIEELVWCRLSVESITAGSEGGAALWRFEDITSQHELDSVHRAQEEKLADLLDLLPAGFFSADADGVILYVNQTLARWLGVSRCTVNRWEGGLAPIPKMVALVEREHTANQPDPTD